MSENLPGDEPASNPVPPSAPPVQPSQPAQSGQPGQPYAAAPGAPVPGVPGAPGALGPAPKKALAITGMSLGIAGLVLSWVPFLGATLALVGLILSIVALVKKQPKAFSITGLVTSIVGLIIGAIVTITVVWAIGAGVDAVQQCMNGAASVEIAGQTVSCSDVDY